MMSMGTCSRVYPDPMVMLTIATSDPEDETLGMNPEILYEYGSLGTGDIDSSLSRIDFLMLQLDAPKS